MVRAVQVWVWRVEVEAAHPAPARGRWMRKPPPAKRAKTEPEAGVAVKPFDQRPSRFKSDDLIEVPLPNGLVMLFSTQSHVMLYNPRATDLKLEGGDSTLWLPEGELVQGSTVHVGEPPEPHQGHPLRVDGCVLYHGRKREPVGGSDYHDWRPGAGGSENRCGR